MGELMTTLADSLATRMQTLGQTIISNISQWYSGGVFYQNGPPVRQLALTIATVREAANSAEIKVAAT